MHTNWVSISFANPIVSRSFPASSFTWFFPSCVHVISFERLVVIKSINKCQKRNRFQPLMTSPRLWSILHRRSTDVIVKSVSVERMVRNLGRERNWLRCFRIHSQSMSWLNRDCSWFTLNMRQTWLSSPQVGVWRLQF